MAVVDIVGSAGQSNMLGAQGDKNEAPNVPSEWGWEYAPGSDSIVAFGEPGSAGDGYKASTASPLAAFLRRVTAAMESPVVVVRSAWSNTSVQAENSTLQGDWSPSGQRFGNAVTRIQACIDRVLADGHTINRVYIVWQGGESDAFGKEALENHATEFAALLTRFRNDLGRQDIEMFVSGIGVHKSLEEEAPEWQIVRDAQEEACETTAGLHMANRDCVHYAEWGYMQDDGIHYKQVGYNHTGYALADFVIDYYGFTPPAGESLLLSPTSVPARMLMPSPKAPYEPIFTSGSGTVKAPLGATSYDAFGYGGGGGGGKGTTLAHGHGGGGAAYAAVFDRPCTGGEEISWAVGAGGAGGDNSNGEHGLAGGDSTIDGGTVLKAVAGQGGTKAGSGGGGAGGQAADCVGDEANSGESGVNNGRGGDGAPPEGGAGGVDTDGSPPGGGGSGGPVGDFGLNGANGRIQFKFKYPQT